ncbi:RING finger protein 223-like [Salarias fasciatus]|uniref:RING finger protein 223-like n=1 Tax=Salarias fasciatus TaxID=181472 RepID=UPI001176A5DE|nr:RING finger protein 223-like [Salarias fasciatus]XP_029947598.1 RING finger protein 223-like [Salarias fasciatus]
MDTLECIVCFDQYSRKDRVPRMLHCNHTFCTPCLQRLSKLEGRMYTVSCPLCRWITCTRASLTLPGSLWINTEIWDQMVAEKKEGDHLKDGGDKLCKPALSHSQRSAFTCAFLKLFPCVWMAS